MSILNRIVADTRALIAERKARTSVTDLEARPAFSQPTRSLRDALSTDGLSVIAEIKKASPSKGVIRPDFDVPTIARQYTTGGAAAISVLTEPLHFQGSLDNLSLARAETTLPLLRKDFIVDPYQLIEARAYGADAVLLIAAVLDQHELADLHQAAHELGLACLVEVYDPVELDKLDLEQIEILGVNNRDLRTFEVNLNHSLDVFARAPETVVRVSESGIQTADDLAHLSRNGVDAVLIGETLMRADDPGTYLTHLLHRSGALSVPTP